MADTSSSRTDSQPGVPASLPLRLQLLRAFLQQALPSPGWLLRPLRLWPEWLQGLHGRLDGSRVHRRWERKPKSTCYSNRYNNKYHYILCKFRIMYKSCIVWESVFIFVWLCHMRICEKQLKSFNCLCHFSSENATHNLVLCLICYYTDKLWLSFFYSDTSDLKPWPFVSGILWWAFFFIFRHFLD